MAEEDRGFVHTFPKEFNNVVRILRNAIPSRHMRGLAMSAQIGSINMPSRRKAGNQRQKNLPPPAEAVEKNQWWAGWGCFSVVEFGFSGIEGTFV
jgi:hypothetical protein